MRVMEGQLRRLREAPPASERWFLAVTLRLWPGWLLVDVGDDDRTPPTLPEGEPFTPEIAGELPEALLPDSGRGLGIVRYLSDFVWWAPRDEAECCLVHLGGRSIPTLSAAAQL